MPAPSLRQLHLRPVRGAGWRPLTRPSVLRFGGRPARGRRLCMPCCTTCHNDVAHYNTVFVAGRPVAFIDRNLAARPQGVGLVYAAYRLVPLTPDEHAAVARRDPLAGECVAAGQQLLVVSGQAAGAAFATQQPEAAEMGPGWSSPAVLVWSAGWSQGVGQGRLW